MIGRFILWIYKVITCLLKGWKRREYIRTGALVLGKWSDGYPTIYRRCGETCKVVVGDYVSIGPEVVMIPGMIHDRSDGRTYQADKPVLTRGDIVIDDDVWICGRVTILSGVHIGRGAVITAGSVVSHNVKPYWVAGGVPAEHIARWREA